MRDLDQLRERDETAGRRLGLFALAGALSIATLIGFVVLEGGGSDDAPAPEVDPLSEWALSAAATREGRAEAAPSASSGSAASARSSTSPSSTPARASTSFRSGSRTSERTSFPSGALTRPSTPAAQELARLSFPATLVGDEAAIEATVRAAEAEHAALTGQGAGSSRPDPRTLAHAEDVPASTLAGEQAERLQRAAKHDPLMAQALPERTRAIAAHGSDGAFMLQVVSFETRGAAERFASALRARGHKAYVTTAEVPGRSRSFRVRVGPFTTRRDAQDYQRAFEESERMHTIVVSGLGK